MLQHYSINTRSDTLTPMRQDTTDTGIDSLLPPHGIPELEAETLASAVAESQLRIEERFSVLWRKQHPTAKRIDETKQISSGYMHATARRTYGGGI